MPEKELKEQKINTLPEGVTKEQIAAWKEFYGENKIKRATLKNENGKKILEAIIRVPDRKTRGQVEMWIDKNPLKAKQTIVNACLLTNKDAVDADDELFEAAVAAIFEILPQGSAEVKNL